MKNILSLLLIATVLVSSCKSSKTADLGDGIFADIQTTQGDIIVKLEYDKTPVTVANFVSLAEGKNPFVTDSLKGKNYYDGLTFHRVMKDFMIQGGDPTGTGMGNPGYRFIDEFVDSLSHSKKGILSMANSGPKTNGSQFFITHKETPWLDNKHTVFGEVVNGMDTLDSIATVAVGENNKPVEAVIMNKVKIIRNGKEAKKFDAVAVMKKYFADEELREKEAARLEAEREQKLAEAKTAFVANLESQKKAAQTLASGLKIFTLEEGTGEKPKVGQTANLYYAGYFEDGRLFDSNVEETSTLYGQFNWNRRDQGGYEPMPMVVSMDAPMIAGFKEAVMKMKVGQKARVFIPSHLAYGESGRGPIPANTDLIFDLEMVDIAQ
ncbi:peptidylprolyl isomerase [Cellulophaga baltica]|uniref:peptidylprolyl isomerase n=1 Tax=Cellulophaga baltica TaxID=76594 RepID=UPI0015F47E25|nr:peptidylprolyl isomerase [Cellulophaga baltica]MBA6314971.1 peptidylprolyl isomerase [Cellulophaga baltica]